MERMTVVAHTDGACKGNPGPGGWAAILVCNGQEKVLRGREPYTTNNRMELTAVIGAIKVLKKPCNIQIMTDSQYVMISRAKWEKWQKKPDLKNKDLWDELIEVGLKGGHMLTFTKVKGHSGQWYNERCDYIAREQARKAKEENGHGL